MLPSLLTRLLWPRRRRALATLVIGSQAECLFELCRPSLQAYASRLGADLQVIRHNPYPEKQSSNYFGKLALGQLLERYERVLYVDCDLIIEPGTPDLFAAVPAATLGAYLEGAVIDRTEDFQWLESQLGQHPGWTTDRYFNAGVLVLSRAHRGLFEPPPRFDLGPTFHDQAYLNWKAHSLNIPLHALDGRFNAMYPYTADPENAWITHYAGFGFTIPPNWRDRPAAFPFKYHQMLAHGERHRGKTVQYFHPGQFVRDLGTLVPHPPGLDRMHVEPKAIGVVGYGPFLPLAAGRYRVQIEHALDSAPQLPNVAPLFDFDLVSESGARTWYKATADTHAEDTVFEVVLPALAQVEVRFWAVGAPCGFFIDRVRLERLGAN